MPKGYSLAARGRQQVVKEAPKRYATEGRSYEPKDGCDAFWAEELDDDDRWRYLISWVTNTTNEQMTRYQQIVRYATMYQYGAKGFPSATPRTKTINEAELAFNRCYFVIHTIMSDTFTVEVTPQFYCEGGTYEDREFAEDATAAVQSVLDDANYYLEEELATRDAISASGTGFLRVAPDFAQECVVIKRMNPLDVRFDEMEGRDRAPRTVSIRHNMEIGQASSMFDVDLKGMKLYGSYDERRMLLEAAESVDILSDEKSMRRKNRCEIWEGVHLPSRWVKPGVCSDDGMQLWACNGGGLECNAWTAKTFDVIPVTPVPAFTGSYGIPLMRFLASPQRELEVTDLRLQRAFRRLGGVSLAIPRSAKIAPRQLTNDSGVAFEYSGNQPPTPLIIPPVHDSVLAYRQMLDQDIIRFSGQNMTAATGAIPPNLTNVSGKALNMAIDTGSRVNAYVLRCRERTVVATTDRVLDAIALLVEKNPNLTARFLKGAGYKTIRWKEILDRRSELKLKCKPINALSTHPTARMQQATQLLGQRAIDNTEWRVITRIGDVKANDMLALSHRDRVEQILDTIVRYGKYLPPEPFYNLQECLAIGVAYYQMCQVQKVPESKLRLVRQWCEDSQLEIEKAEADRLAKQQAMQPPMMGPGGPQGPEPPPGPGGPPGGGGAMKPIEVHAPPTMMAPGGALQAA